MIALLVVEVRHHEPLIDVRFFRSIPFASATILAVAAFGSLGGFLFLNTLYLQEVRGLSALHAGLDTLPMAVMAMLTSPISGHLVGREGSRVPLLIAGVTMVAGCAMLSDLSPTTSFSWLFGAYVLFGIGFGLVNPPITNTAVSGMPRDQAGLASGITSTARQVGQTLGVAIVGAIVTAGVSERDHLNFASASHAGWWVLVGAGMVILVLGAVSTSKRALRSATRTAERINPEWLDR